MLKIISFCVLIFFSMLAAAAKSANFKQVDQVKKLDLLNEGTANVISAEQVIQEVPQQKKLQIGAVLSQMFPQSLSIASNGNIKDYQFNSGVSLIGVEYKNYNFLSAITGQPIGGRINLSYGNIQDFNGQNTRLHLAPISLVIGKRYIYPGYAVSGGLGYSQVIFVQRGIDEMNFSGVTGSFFADLSVSRIFKTSSRFAQELSLTVQQYLTNESDSRDFRGQNIGIGVSFIL